MNVCDECGGETFYGCGRMIHVKAFEAHIDANGPLAMDKFVDAHDTPRLVILDEAESLSEEFLETFSDPDARIMAIGSPDDPHTEFVPIFR